MLNALLFTLLPFVGNPGLLFLFDYLLKRYYKDPYENKNLVIIMGVLYFINIGFILFVPEIVGRIAEYRQSM